jgi:hypothetical protein
LTKTSIYELNLGKDSTIICMIDEPTKYAKINLTYKDKTIKTDFAICNSYYHHYLNKDL